MITVNNKIIIHHEGMTVEDAVLDAGEAVDSMTIIMVDKKIIQHDQIDEIIADNTNIKVLRILSGG